LLDREVLAYFGSMHAFLDHAPAARAAGDPSVGVHTQYAEYHLRILDRRLDIRRNGRAPTSP